VCTPTVGLRLAANLPWRLGWKLPPCLLNGLLLVLTFTAACWLLGYNSGDVESAPDWGENWSANLLSFFDSANTAPIAPPLGRHMPFQSEGFSYLGFFVIIAAPLVHLLGGKRQRATPKACSQAQRFFGACWHK
jgi:hypothetical protein